MPALAPAGYTWLNDGAAPDLVMAFSDQDGHPILAAFWDRPDGTTSGLFPLGSGDRQLEQMPIIGHWKQRDRSLTSIGTFPGRLVRYEVPELPNDYFANILTLGGYPTSQFNQRIMTAHVAMMLKLKAHQHISSQDQRMASRFADTHDGASPQQILEDLGTWNYGVVPYIQDLPGRIQGLLLENMDGQVWKDLERQ
jgi:hypothetical protein